MSPPFNKARPTQKDIAWTFWPPATEDYLIHGIEQVWLRQISTADYLKKMQEIFAKELAEGKVPPPASR